MAWLPFHSAAMICTHRLQVFFSNSKHSFRGMHPRILERMCLQVGAKMVPSGLVLSILSPVATTHVSWKD